MLKVTFAVLNL